LAYNDEPDGANWTAAAEYGFPVSLIVPTFTPAAKEYTETVFKEST